MRYITIPNSIDLVNLHDNTPAGRSISFQEFLGTVFLDQKWGKTAMDILSLADIRQKFLAATPGSVVELSDGDWEKLAAVTKEPTGGYSPLIVVQCTDFLRTILDAPTKKPESKS